MQRRPVLHLFALAVLCSAPLSGCDLRRGSEAAGTEETGAAERPLQGLSPEQIQSQAEPISPEEAQQRGIIDTTVHVSEEP
jgi:hypothetical protein